MDKYNHKLRDLFDVEPTQLEKDLLVKEEIDKEERARIKESESQQDGNRDEMPVKTAIPMTADINSQNKSQKGSVTIVPLRESFDTRRDVSTVEPVLTPSSISYSQVKRSSNALNELIPSLLTPEKRNANSGTCCAMSGGSRFVNHSYYLLALIILLTLFLISFNFLVVGAYAGKFSSHMNQTVVVNPPTITNDNKYDFTMPDIKVNVYNNYTIKVCSNGSLC